MRIVTHPGELQKLCHDWRCRGLNTALVPTMGFFHAGHCSLMRWARDNADRVVVSLFVNPTQFAPDEDLDKYPADRERDFALARKEGVDLLFAPEAGAMYAPGHETVVSVPLLSRGLCGRSRPTHFQGVATVVCKLFNLVLPQTAVFGEKDWQQLAVIRRMVRDLDLPVQVVGRPIVREEDGLAMSSRNDYLTPEQRRQAPVIAQGLQMVRRRVKEGERQAALLLGALQTWLEERVPLGEVDYLEIVDPESLEPMDTVCPRALVAVAVRLGRARLIDNILLEC